MDKHFKSTRKHVIFRFSVFFVPVSLFTISFVSDDIYAEEIDFIRYEDGQIARIMSSPGTCSNTESVDVILGIMDDYNPTQQTPFSYEYDSIHGELLNGKPLDDEGRKWINTITQDRLLQNIEIKRNSRQNTINELLNHGIVISNETSDEYINSYKPLHLALTECELVKLSDLTNLQGIELYKEPQSDSMLSAMQSTSVYESASYSDNNQGEHVGLYISELSCPPDDYFTDYYPDGLYSRLDSSIGSTEYNDIRHGRNVTAIAHIVSPNASIYCRTGCTLPNDNDITTHLNSYAPIKISSLSCSICSSSNDYSIEDKAVDNQVHDTRITHINSAGNYTTGCSTYNVKKRARGLNVITVGNYIDYNNTPSQFSINDSSSYIDPNSKNMKPELSAPGTSINAGYDSNGSIITMSGTSQATPHVAGMLASSMYASSTTIQSPAMTKAMAIFGATDSVNGGDDKVGMGGLDFISLNRNSHGYHIGSFEYAASSDITPNNNTIDHVFLSVGCPNFALNCPKVRIAISWLVKGDEIYNNIDQEHPMLSDYDIEISGPNGIIIPGTISGDNNFKVLEFTIHTAGFYTWSIRRTRSSFSSLSDFELGWAFKYTSNSITQTSQF